MRLLAVAVVLVAAISRLLGLGTHPPGFFRDEADKGYTAYLLLKTGRDGAGRSYPLFVKSLRVTTSAVYQYIEIPFVALFGLQEWAVRLPAALAGCGAVLATFFLARRWWGATAGLLAAGFLAVSPWHVLLSRWANQSILLTLWIPLGLLWFDCFLTHVRTGGKVAFGCLSSLSFALALYTYEPAQLFVPLLVFSLVGLAIWHRQVLGTKRWLLLPVLLFCLLAIPMIWHVLTEPEESARRFRAISVFAAGRGWGTIWLLLRNYLAHLSPVFLFLGGDANPRHSTGFPGQTHLYLAPLLAAGLWRCVRRPGYREHVLLTWFLLFPVPAACTSEGIPHALRSIFGLPVLQLISILGTKELRDILLPQWKRAGIRLLSNEQLLVTLWLVCSVVLLFVFLINCFWLYPNRSAAYWEYGYREAAGWWLDHRREFPRAIVSGLAEYPEVFFLFYGNVDPETWIETQKVPGVEFLETGRTMRDRYRASEKGLAYLVRPGELPRVVPQYVVYTHGTSDPIWLWVGQPLDQGPSDD
jgi:4-amino-4-deoxy-L-arabinose transferase-like glycosyltransferase